MNGTSTNPWLRFLQPENWHEAANIYPMMSDAEIAALTEDIEQNGLRNPIALIREGDSVRVLDGRNRAKALAQFDDADILESDFTYWEHSEQESPVTYVVSQNTHRRHLTKDQLTIVAAKIAVALEEESRKWQIGALKKGNAPPVVANLQQRQERSVEKASKAVNGAVSPRQVSEGVKILKRNPELAEKVANGKLKVSQAKNIVKEGCETKTIPQTSDNAMYKVGAVLYAQERRGWTETAGAVLLPSLVIIKQTKKIFAHANFSLPEKRNKVCIEIRMVDSKTGDGRTKKGNTVEKVNGSTCFTIEVLRVATPQDIKFVRDFWSMMGRMV